MQKVSDLDFVRAWETAQTLDELTQQTGQARTSVLARASKMRTRGVPLRSLRNGNNRQPMDVAGLRQLLAELRGATVEEIQRESQVWAEARKARREALGKGGTQPESSGVPATT
jgi:hypothetical protein